MFVLKIGMIAFTLEDSLKRDQIVSGGILGGKSVDPYAVVCFFFFFLEGGGWGRPLGQGWECEQWWAESLFNAEERACAKSPFQGA